MKFETKSKSLSEKKKLKYRIKNYMSKFNYYNIY